MKLRKSYIAGILFCLLATLPAAQNSQAPEFIEGRYFEIIGTDIRSVSFTNTLGEHIAEILNRCLTAGSHEFSQPVVVVLQSEKDVEFKEPGFSDARPPIWKHLTEIGLINY